MIPPFARRLGLASIVLAVTPVITRAQWSANPAVNLLLADRTNEQVQPKIRQTPDGGSYVSWYDNSGGGYDMYLQHLSADGTEQWPHNGIQIADLTFSSTEDYDLDVDARRVATEAGLAFARTASINDDPPVMAALAATAGTALAGVAFCEVRRRSGGLVAPFALQWALNALGLLVAWLAFAPGA